MTDVAPLQLALAPGDYGCTWTLPMPAGEQARQIQGSVELAADAPPRGSMRGRVPIRWSPGSNGEVSADLPQDLNLPILQGRLHNGLILSILEAHVEIWSDTQAFVDGRAGLIGELSVETNAAPTFTSIKMQIEELDVIGGRSPIRSYGLPDLSNDHLDGTWTIEGEPDSSQKWEDGVDELSYSFDASSSTFNYYRFHMSFSPTLVINSSRPRTLAQWLDDWVAPLRRIVCLATGRQERITYLALKAAGRPEQAGPPATPWLQVFGTGLTQAPFASDHNRLRGRTPAWTITSDTVSLLAATKNWLTQSRAHHPLIETYGEFVGNRPQHPRSQFLLLLQALEGLHGHERKEAQDIRTATHQVKRSAAIADENFTTLATEHQEFIRRNLSSRPYGGGLEDALHYCLGSLPVDLSDELNDASLVTDMRSEGATSLADALRRVRNDLAHGNRGFDTPKLHEVNKRLERVARAHLLRLLGCSEITLKRALRYPDS